MTTAASVSKKAKTPSKAKPKPNSKHQYGVGTEWNTPSDSHHLILHLRIQPSARVAANDPAAPEAFPGEGGGDSATFKELLKYRPELDLPPEAYEQLGSDSYPYRFESPATQASGRLGGLRMRSDLCRGRQLLVYGKQTERGHPVGRRVARGPGAQPDAVAPR